MTEPEIVEGSDGEPIIRVHESPRWKAEPPEEDGWYVVGWAADAGRPAYACIKVVGNRTSSPYAGDVRWWPVPIDLPPLPRIPEEEPTSSESQPLMSVIWKYPLDPSRRSLTTLQMPLGAKVLTVAAQDGNVCLWAECAVEGPPQERQFMVVPTGVEVDLDGTTYVGTVFLDDLVFHVYARESN